MKTQDSFVEAFASRRLGRNARLERVAKEVKWYRFEKLLGRLKPEGAGRPPYDPLLMFKALLLQQWYALSDSELEDSLNDRFSFRRFLGLALESDAPDHTTLCRFRNRLVEQDLLKKLFDEFDRQLEARGLVLKEGTMLDATLVEAATPRPRGDEEEEEAKDPDARFGKGSKPGFVYGYKAHVGVDCKSRLIRAALVTPANINDTEVADRLIRFDERAVYADKAYAKRERRAMLKEHGIQDGIMHKSWGGGPKLKAWQISHNKAIAPIRAEVETVFAIAKRRMGFARARYIGLAKNATHFLLLAIAYNMRRAAAMTL
ncbi:MAG: IS5 family transposase [Alphaproteobacteria bacterium]